MKDSYAHTNTQTRIRRGRGPPTNVKIARSSNTHIHSRVWDHHDPKSIEFD